MSNRYVIEALLRPAVELNTAVVAGVAAFVCIRAPWAVALAPSVSYVTAAGFGVLAAARLRQGTQIIRYRRNLTRLPRYVMRTKQIPVSRHRLFLGRGFRWTQKHTQRLQDTLRPEVAKVPAARAALSGRPVAGVENGPDGARGAKTAQPGFPTEPRQATATGGGQSSTAWRGA
jgi:hypothetical protein